MMAQLEISRPSEIGQLLRGETEAISDWSHRWSAGRFILHLAVIVMGSGLYGATMGGWRAPEQALFVAIKFPLIILLVTAGNALINGLLAPLLGLSIRFYQSFSAIVMSFTVTSVILGAFSPVMAFLIWNAPSMGAKGSEFAYCLILLAHVAVIALAGITGNVRLLQLLVRLSNNRAIALRVLGAWLTGNLFWERSSPGFCGHLLGLPDCLLNFYEPTRFTETFTRRFSTLFKKF